MTENKNKNRALQIINGFQLQLPFTREAFSGLSSASWAVKGITKAIVVSPLVIGKSRKNLNSEMGFRSPEIWESMKDHEHHQNEGIWIIF